MQHLSKICAAIIALLALVFSLGPRPEFEPVDPRIRAVDIPIEELEQFIADREDGIENLKENNESRIIWADSTRKKTTYSLVYLHGFSASPMEGHPTHVRVAKAFGLNLYIPRIVGHGIDDRDSFSDLTQTAMIDAAKEAIAIGKVLGEKVIVMSCSTGGTYSIYLAAHNPSWIDAMILYSPNISLYNRQARLLTGPWGIQLGKMIAGEYRVIPGYEGTEQGKYTTTVYRIEGVVALQVLLNATMTDEVFERVSTPYFLGYYYKDDESQDRVVDVSAMQVFDQLTSTTESRKWNIPFPESDNHVIPSGLHSRDVPAVIARTVDFLEQVVGLERAESTTAQQDSL